MEGLVIAAAELRRRIKVHVRDVVNIRCHLVITAKKLMLEPVQLTTQGSDVWTPVDVMISSSMAVLVADCPDE